MRKTILLIVTVLLATMLSAQNNVKENIFDALSKKDSVSGAVVKMHQNKSIEQRVARGTTSANGSIQSVTTTGYRVQVFSSNTQRTARGEAYKIEKEIRDAFPEHEVYVSYTSPFWRVRIGNFRSIDEAQAFRSQVIKTFPNLRTDTYTVRDQIQL
jgi:septal ring-binding cell division protein DamX